MVEIKMDDAMLTGKEYTRKITFQDNHQISSALLFEFLNSVGVQEKIFFSLVDQKKRNFEETDKVSGLFLSL